MDARQGKVLVAMGLGLVALLGVVGVLGAEWGGAPAGTAVVTGSGPAVERPLSERESAALAAQVFYVDADAAGADTGLSWTDAFTEVQKALTVVQAGDQVWVAEGVYYPDYDPDLDAHTGWVTATFSLTNGVALYGGFDPGSGVEALEQRDPAAYLTVLSGDLDRNDLADAYGVVTTTENITGSNAWTVVTASGVDETAALDGLTITAGSANGAESECKEWEPCRSGGGMYNVDSSPSLVDVAFLGNSAGYGGGITNYLYSSPTLVNVTFSGNSAGTGGGMMSRFGTSPTLIGVRFSGNAALYGGGGLSNCESSPLLVNVEFSGNSSGWSGGGVDNYWEARPTLVNVTFSGNSARFGGGIHNEDGSTPTLTNCVLWGNAAEEGAQIYNWGSGDITVINYSLVQDGCPTGSICDAKLLTGDPLFVDSAGGDLRLQPESPAIDAGDNSAVPPEIITDLAGNPRFVDIASVLDTGNGAPPIVDMGAYEALPPVIYVDWEASGENTGSSWADAFADLQTALALAAQEVAMWTVEGVDIWVAEGVYYPDYDPDLDAHTGWVTATFSLTNGVALYGGFDPGSGVEALEQRDPAAYLTVLSGDLDRNDLAGAHGVVTTTESISGSNSYHVVTGREVDGTAVLDGFVITAGNADGNSCPGPGCGGGMIASLFVSPTVRNVTFSGNRAALAGGGLDCDNHAAPTLVNVVFSGNTAVEGGGMSALFSSNPSLVNVTFSGNSAQDHGGGMYNRESSSPSLTNVTFSGNSAQDHGGGIANWDSSSPTLANCILWGNSADTGAQVYNHGSTDVPVVNHSLVQDGCPAGALCDSNLLTGDPLFVDAAGGDLRLRPGSPAIDAGDNAAVPLWVTTDLAGWPRIINGTVDMGAYETPLAAYLPLALRAAW